MNSINELIAENTRLRGLVAAEVALTIAAFDLSESHGMDEAPSPEFQTICRQAEERSGIPATHACVPFIFCGAKAD